MSDTTIIQNQNATKPLFKWSTNSMITLNIGLIIVILWGVYAAAVAWTTLNLRIDQLSTTPTVTREEFSVLNTNVVNLTNRFISLETKMDKIIDSYLGKN